MPQIIMIIGLVSLACAFIGAFVAKLKNRSADLWAFSCFLFPPALLLLLVLPKSKTGPRRPMLTRKEIDDLKEDFFD